MKNLLIIFSILIFVVIQTAMFPFFRIGGVEPNLVLVFIMTLVVLSGFKNVWRFALLAGLILDVFSGLPFGLVSFCFISVSFLIDWLNRVVFSIAKFWLQSGLVGLMVLFYDLFLIVLGRLFLSIDFVFSFKYWFWDAVYNLLIAFVFFYGAKKVFYQKQGARNN